MSGKSMTSPASQNALADTWVERLFQLMENRYGNLWADRYGAFPRERVKRSWAEDLVDLTRDELAKGAAACREMKFPPTLPEFRQLCRPALDYEAAWNEAQNNLARRDSGKPMRWSSKAVYWSYVAFGSHDLRNTPYVVAKSRWQKTMNEIVADERDSGLPEIPPEREAIPAPGKTSITQEEAKSRVKAVAGSVTGPTDHKAWARRILEAPAGYPAISVAMAREAMHVQEAA